jgi:hypothetical protein
MDDQQAMLLLSNLLDSMDSSSSGGPGGATGNIGRRRSRDIQRRLQHLRHVGMNLEDLMMMEAMRRSMAESSASASVASGNGGTENQQVASSLPSPIGAAAGDTDAEWEPIPAELLQPETELPLDSAQDNDAIHASFTTDDSNTPLGILRDRQQRASFQEDAITSGDILTGIHNSDTTTSDENLPLAQLQHSSAESPSIVTTPRTEVDTKSLPPLETPHSPSLSQSTSPA